MKLLTRGARADLTNASSSITTFSLLLFPSVDPTDVPSFNNINIFILRLYFSYRPLNNITRSFEYLIPCCTDSVENLSDFYDSLSTVSLDSRSGYHQVKVRPYD